MASLVRQHSKRGAGGNESPSSGDALPISMPSAASSSIHDRRRLSDADTEQNGERHGFKGDSNELAGEDHETHNEGEEPTNEDEGYSAVDSDGLPNYAWFLTGTSAKSAPRPNALDHLHPFVQLLSLADLEDCIKVEEAFPPHERCSKEKLRYRLTRCPELSLGLFSLPPKSEWKDGQRPERATLIAHIIATRTSSLIVTDKSMDIPENWESKSSMPLSSEPAVGHEEGGLTIAIHSLAVLQEHQGKRLGSTLMKAYLQRIKEAATAKRVALIAHDHLIPFYELFGFCNQGRSACQFGGGGWFDMVLFFSEDTDSEDSFPL